MYRPPVMMTVPSASAIARGPVEGPITIRSQALAAGLYNPKWLHIAPLFGGIRTAKTLSPGDGAMLKIGLELAGPCVHEGPMKWLPPAGRLAACAGGARPSTSVAPA